MEESSNSCQDVRHYKRSRGGEKPKVNRLSICVTICISLYILYKLKHPTLLDQLKTLNYGKLSSREWNVTTYKTENIKLEIRI